MKLTFRIEFSNAIEEVKRKLNKEYTFEENSEMFKKVLDKLKLTSVSQTM